MAAGSIVFDLLMNTASFETDSKRAEKRLKELQKQAVEFGKAVGVAAVAGVAALTYSITETISSMDDLSKSASKVGTTTEALSALQYAAGLSDVATEDLTASMAKLAKAAVDGNEGLDAMGISAKDSQGNIKDTSALMSEIAGKFAQYKDGAEKTALAQEIFGKSGANLIPLLNSGAEGLKEMADEAKRFGLIVDGDAGKAAGTFNDTLTQMKSAGKGVLTTVATGMLPALQGLADQLLDVTTDTATMAKASSILTNGLRLLVSGIVIVGGVFKTVGSLIGNVAGYIVTSVTDGLESAYKAIVAIGSALKLAASGDFAEAGKQLGSIGEIATANAKKSMEGIGAIGEDLVADITGTVAAVQKVWEDGAAKAKAVADDPKGGLDAPIVKAAKNSKKAKTEIDKAAKEAEAAMKRMVEEGKRLAESVQTPFEKKTATEGKVGTLADAGVISPETQRRALDAANKEYQDYVAAQRALLTEGLLTEEQEVAASYERRKQMILAITEATESEKAAAVASLTEKYDQDQAAARIARYRDLLTAEETLSVDYAARQKQIVADGTLSEEQRNEYLSRSAKDYYDGLAKLAKEDADKRAELSRKQVEMVADGFGQAADVAKAFAGEQSGVYQALFAASKSFAIADIAIKQSQAIAKAWGENNYWVAAGLTVGLAAQFAGLLSSAQSANFGGARADGGPVNAGRSYLVGERGPEMFTPAAGGNIIPADAMAAPASEPNIRIVNAYDDGHIDDYLGSDSAEQKIVNAVRRNKRALGI